MDIGIILAISSLICYLCIFWIIRIHKDKREGEFDMCFRIQTAEVIPPTAEI